MVPFSMTLSDPKTLVSRSQHSLKANISQTVHPIHFMSSCIGKDFRGRLIEWRYFRFDNVQGGGWRPSWNDGAVARNPCVSWAFLYSFAYPVIVSAMVASHRPPGASVSSAWLLSVFRTVTFAM